MSSTIQNLSWSTLDKQGLSSSCKIINNLYEMQRKLRTGKYCANAFGLVVKTKDKKIVLVRRRVPYCVQNFYYDLHCKSRFSQEQELCYFSRVKDQFETEYFDRLGKQEQLDYFRFKQGSLPFEDEFDLPHGQCQQNEKFTGNTHSKEKTQKFQLFLTAYREFKEESGFRFSFTPEEVQTYPMIQIKFKALDDNFYTQNYFIVDNVKGLKRSYFNFNEFGCSQLSTPREKLYSVIKTKHWNEDILIYQGLLVSMGEAYNLFQRQQSIKQDGKHLLCLNSQTILNILTNLREEDENNNDATQSWKFDSIHSLANVSEIASGVETVS